MSMKPQLMGIAAAALIVGLTGCGSSTTTGGAAETTSQTSTSSPMTPGTSASAAAPSTSDAKPVVITVKDFKYSVPGSVAPGAKVSVKNLDAQNHTLTSAPKGAFEVLAKAGETVTFTAPTKAGSYTFICDFHADMMGTLVVT